MTNAEMAKQIKEFSEKLDRYFANQEATIGKYDGEIKQLNDKLEELAERVNGLGIVAQETTRQLKEQTDRLNRYRDVLDKQFATYDSKIKQLKEQVDRLDRYRDVQDKQFVTYDSKIKQLETSLMQLRLTISSVSSVYGIPEKAKTLESIYPCLWKCEHKGKECDGLAQECPIAEHFSAQLKTGHLGDKSTEAIKHIENENVTPEAFFKAALKVHNDALRTEENKPLWAEDFSKFNAGKMAIVFDGSDPHFEATYLDFWRVFDEWCRTSEKDDRLYPQSSWVTRGFRMNPLMKCPSIYKDHASFAIWTEWDDEEKDEPTFEYGTLMTDWREHKTVGWLPYTVWRV